MFIEHTIMHHLCEVQLCNQLPKSHRAQKAMSIMLYIKVNSHLSCPVGRPCYNIGGANNQYISLEAVHSTILQRDSHRKATHPADLCHQMGKAMAITCPSRCIYHISNC